MKTLINLDNSKREVTEEYYEDCKRVFLSGLELLWNRDGLEPDEKKSVEDLWTVCELNGWV